MAIHSLLQENKASKSIENAFPIDFVSCLAEHESWRKEIYRPIYYIHKWWARRLGSVFRAILLGCCAGTDEDITDLFYKRVSFPDTVVFDPFMGSGTTVGEAIKLGCRVIGRDINPVSVNMVRTALKKYSEADVRNTFNALATNAVQHIKPFYYSKLPDGDLVDTLYYFWVKIINCPECGSQIELFKNRIFAKHAYTKKHPQAKALCPYCGAVNNVKYNTNRVTCPSCESIYNPQDGPVKRNGILCPTCGFKFQLINVIRTLSNPPEHKMYAKMILTQDNEKVILPIDEYDIKVYQDAAKSLITLRHHIPEEDIQPGYNTNQVLNYNYRYWHQMFNERQLVCLALLAQEIKNIPDENLKNLFACLFSGVLEFNNMFATFKGFGSGAVRHMFSNHILKPELTPLEANVWGTHKSSGSFSTLFESRIIRALEYKNNPFELKLTEKRKGKKVYDLNKPINVKIANNFRSFISDSQSVYLSTGDSSNTDIPDDSVDLVVTDPPFFDNVHYSELADFFYVWIRKIIGTKGVMSRTSTRSTREVQNTDAGTFSNRLKSVFRECNRILKEDGLLVFTYHHSRLEGWTAVYKAVREAGFYITQAHPVKAEMAVAVPIQKAKVPINYDLILVCSKKRPENQVINKDNVLYLCKNKTEKDCNKLIKKGLNVSVGDENVIFMGHVLVNVSCMNNINGELTILQEVQGAF